MQAIVTVDYDTLKTGGEVAVPKEELEALVEDVKDAITEVDPKQYTTCVEDRLRSGVRSGEKKVEPRRSAPGGSEVWGFTVMLMTGQIPEDTEDPDQMMHAVENKLQRAGIPPGAHEKCAAREQAMGILGLAVSGDRLGVQAYAQRQLGEDYDQTAADAVLANMEAALGDPRLKTYTGDEVEHVLGTEAGNAFETLEPGDHEGFGFIRDYLPGNKTVDQNKLGGRSFVNDEELCDQIERAMADTPDAERLQVIARHGREMYLHALFQALPVPELHQIDVR